VTQSDRRKALDGKPFGKNMARPTKSIETAIENIAKALCICNGRAAGTARHTQLENKGLLSEHCTDMKKG